MRRQEELRRLEELRNQELQRRKQIEMRCACLFKRLMWLVFTVKGQMILFCFSRGTDLLGSKSWFIFTPFVPFILVVYILKINENYWTRINLTIRCFLLKLIEVCVNRSAIVHTLFTLCFVGTRRRGGGGRRSWWGTESRRTWDANQMASNQTTWKTWVQMEHIHPPAWLLSILMWGYTAT